MSCNKFCTVPNQKNKDRFCDNSIYRFFMDTPVKASRDYRQNYSTADYSKRKCKETAKPEWLTDSSDLRTETRKGYQATCGMKRGKDKSPFAQSAS